MPTVEENMDAETSESGTGRIRGQKNRRQLLTALLILLMALILVLLKDRQFWFPSSPGSESENVEQGAPEVQSPAPTQNPATSSSPQLPPAPQQTVKPKKTKPKQTAAITPPVAVPQEAAGPMITATNRAVLPPLEVEVVAGDQHRTVSPGSNSVNVEMQTGSLPSPARTVDVDPSSGRVATVSDQAQVSLSPGTVERVSRPVDPTYPLLAKQMKVQGAVVLRALIDRTGNIQDLHVLSGPAILAAAAEQAVKLWHFKPYYQQGQPVETEARITVNFTISTY